jgi:hypothetical protein
MATTRSQSTKNDSSSDLVPDNVLEMQNKCIADFMETSQTNQHAFEDRIMQQLQQMQQSFQSMQQSFQTMQSSPAKTNFTPVKGSQDVRSIDALSPATVTYVEKQSVKSEYSVDNATWQAVLTSIGSSFKPINLKSDDIMSQLTDFIIASNRTFQLLKLQKWFQHNPPSAVNENGRSPAFLTSAVPTNNSLIIQLTSNDILEINKSMALFSQCVASFAKDIPDFVLNGKTNAYRGTPQKLIQAYWNILHYFNAEKNTGHTNAAILKKFHNLIQPATQNDMEYLNSADKLRLELFPIGTNLYDTIIISYVQTGFYAQDSYDLVQNYLSSLPASVAPDWHDCLQLFSSAGYTQTLKPNRVPNPHQKSIVSTPPKVAFATMAERFCQPSTIKFLGCYNCLNLSHQSTTCHFVCVMCVRAQNGIGPFAVAMNCTKHHVASKSANAAVGVTNLSISPSVATSAAFQFESRCIDDDYDLAPAYDEIFIPGLSIRESRMVSEGVGFGLSFDDALAAARGK